MSMTPEVRRGDVGYRKINEALLDAVTLDSYAVAGLPAANLHTGKLVFVSNGASGAACLAYSNGTNWLRIVLGAAVSAT
jgi:hypothetical protein